MLPLLLVGSGILAAVLLTSVVAVILLRQSPTPRAPAVDHRPAANREIVEGPPLKEPVPQPKGPKQQDDNAALPAIKVSAEDLITAYAGNSLNADRTYKDKVLEVTGKVDDEMTYKVVSTWKAYIYLKDRVDLDRIGTHSGIECGFRGLYDGVVEMTRARGISVTVRGRCESGGSKSVLLKDCSLVTTKQEMVTRTNDLHKSLLEAKEREVVEATAIRVNPKDLYHLDAREKYVGRVVEVTGVVNSISKQSGEITVKVRDAGPVAQSSPHVECSFTLKHEEALAKVKPGEGITIRGKCEKAAYMLQHCTLVKPPPPQKKRR